MKYFSSSWLVGWLIELKEISKIVSGEIENLCQDRDQAVVRDSYLKCRVSISI